MKRPVEIVAVCPFCQSDVNLEGVLTSTNYQPAAMPDPPRKTVTTLNLTTAYHDCRGPVHDEPTEPIRVRL